MNLELRVLPFLEGDAVPLCAEVDPEVFFPEVGGDTGAVAKRICRRCEVREACAQYAIDERIEVGIWGGTGKRERRRRRSGGCERDDR